MPEPTETTLSYRFARFTFGMFFRIWFRWKVLHRERVPAKGGVILPIREKFQLPVKFVGLGEGVDDIAAFDAAAFAKALFAQ